MDHTGKIAVKTVYVEKAILALYQKKTEGLRILEQQCKKSDGPRTLHQIKEAKEIQQRKKRMRY